MEWFDSGWSWIWEGTVLSPGVITLRLLTAALLGALIGIEREAVGRQAGLRTHMLISVSACLFTLVTLELFEFATAHGSGNPDPIRVVEAVTAGVAFIAAGAIFRAGENGVKGLTTGAGLWAAGAIGTAVGAGYIALAVCATVIVFVILAVIRLLEKVLF